jgi:hypothetical protein
MSLYYVCANLADIRLHCILCISVPDDLLAANKLLNKVFKYMQAQLEVLHETVHAMLDDVNTRMVQFYSKSILSQTLGVMSRNHAFLWLGDPHSTTTEWRPDRDCDGRGHQDIVLQWHFQEGEVGTIPLSYHNWHHLMMCEKTGPRRKLHFRIINITLNYNIDTKTGRCI